MKIAILLIALWCLAAAQTASSPNVAEQQKIIGLEQRHHGIYAGNGAGRNGRC